MGVPSAGAVVLVPFPFSDLSQTKLRPAIVLAFASRGDWILCQVTSNPYSDPSAVPFDSSSMRSGSIRVESFARPSKLLTANESLIASLIGELKPDKRVEILNAVIGIFEGALA